MDRKPAVFVSYSHPSSSWTASFVHNLREQGLDAFPDAGTFKSGEDIATQIRKKLEASSYVVVVWDKNSTKSQWTAFELGAANTLGKPILAIVDPNLPSESLPQSVVRFQKLPKGGPKVTAERVAHLVSRLSSAEPSKTTGS